MDDNGCVLTFFVLAHSLGRFAKLSYRDLTPKHKWWDWIKGDRKIPWKEVKGFIFGAQSTTFEKHRKRVHEQLLYQKSVHESEKAMLIKQLT